MLYDSPSPFLRFVRRLLNPILRLFFNPTPVAHALAVQGKLNAAAAQADHSAARPNGIFHFEILQRVVTEISRVSLEAQSLALRVESLSAKVDFNERRVRGLEGSSVRAVRPQEAAGTPPSDAVPVPSTDSAAQQQSADSQPAQPGDAPRRRRRRRRGRRGTGGMTPTQGASGIPADSRCGRRRPGRRDRRRRGARQRHDSHRSGAGRVDRRAARRDRGAAGSSSARACHSQRDRLGGSETIRSRPDPRGMIVRINEDHQRRQ